MKRKNHFGRFFIAVLLLAFAAAPAAAQVRLGFRFYGGWNYLGGGDLNRGAEGFADVFRYLFADDGYTTQDKFSPAHSGLDFGGDLVLEFTPSFGLFLGAGYARASRKSEISYSKTGPSFKPTVTAEPAADAVRLSLQAYYVLPTTSGLSLVFHAGPEFYLARMRINTKTTVSYGAPIGFMIEASGQGLGFQGGLGLEYSLGASVGFFLEIVGRYAHFSGFDGTTTIDVTGSPISQHGELYYVVGPTSSGGSISIVMCYPTPPDDPDDVARAAKIDFSGFSLRLGVVFRIGPRK
jgi:hypothetical protein